MNDIERIRDRNVVGGRQTVGRYTRVGNVSLNVENLPKAGEVNANVTIKHGTAVDPDPEQKLRQRVAVNIKHDVLEQEYARARISEAAYRAGRLIEEALPMLGGAGTSQWMQGDRVDGGQKVNDTIEKSLDRAKKADRLMQGVRAAVGAHDANMLRMLLGEGKTMQEVVASFGAPVTERTINYQMRRFRDALEWISESWAAVGKQAS